MMKTEQLELKIKEVLTTLKGMSSKDAESILKQSLHNLSRASTVNNIEEMEMDYRFVP